MESFRSVLRTLLRDPVVRITAVVFGLCAIPYFVPLFSRDRMAVLVENWFDLIAIGLVLLALQAGLSRVGAGTRRLAWYLTAGAGLWLAVRVFYLAVPEIHGLPQGDIPADLLYLGFYVCVILASQTEAHLETSLRRVDLAQRVEMAAAVFFVAFTLAYFVLIPTRIDWNLYESWVPSLYMFLALDVYLLARFLYLAGRAPSSRYRWIYGLLAATAGFWTLTDLLECLTYAGVLSIWPGSKIDLLWWPAYFALIAAVRVRHVPFDDDAGEVAAARAPVHPARPVGPMVAVAFAPALLHLGMYSLGLLDERGRAQRDLLVLGTTFGLAKLVLLHQWVLARANRALETHLQRIQQQLVQSQKMEAVGRLAGGVAHDFNNLLTAILGHNHLLRERLADDDPLQKEVRGIRDASGRAAGLTRQLLAFARPQTLTLEVLDLNTVLTGMENLLRRVVGEDIDLMLVLEPGIGAIRADRTRIEQIVVNLVVNARDAMPDGGTLAIETSRGRFDPSSPDSPRLPDPCVVLRVRDEGCGMDAETASRIFEPFFTTKREGSGLGLATVYGIVRQSEGTIRVDTRPGAGTSIEVHLPITDEPITVPPIPIGRGDPEARRPAQAGAAKSILVVEDEDSVRELILDALAEQGYSLLEARDGKTAIEVLERHVEGVDLLVTDVVMPGMSGPNLAREIAMRQPGVRVLFISGYHDEDAFDHRRPHPGAVFLPKPFTPRALTGKVREMLDGQD